VDAAFFLLHLLVTKIAVYGKQVLFVLIIQ